jgi:hypothetical protein
MSREKNKVVAPAATDSGVIGDYARAIHLCGRGHTLPRVFQLQSPNGFAYWW